MSRKHQHPLRGVTDFFNERARMTDAFFERGNETRQRTAVTAWTPPTDILAHGKDIVIRCEVPGVEMEDTEITFSNGVLTVSGNRYTEQDEDSWGYYVRERYYGAFRRVIGLPEGVDEADIHAQFRNGLLTITVTGGVAAAKRSTKIDISADGT